jgi:hypothetical protein
MFRDALKFFEAKRIKCQFQFGSCHQTEAGVSLTSMLLLIDQYRLFRAMSIV